MKTPWLTIVGIGEDGMDGLAPLVRALIDSAEILVGGARHLALVPSTARKLDWPSPFSAGRALLEGHKGRRVVVLASGDPMWFGAGATLAGWFGAEALDVVPHPGAFSLAAARLKWPLQDCRCLTAHGRPVSALTLNMVPGARLLVLSEDGATPSRIRDLLAEMNLSASRLVVLEAMGGPFERITEGVPAECAPLNLVAVEVKGARTLPLVPGLPDDAFLHDGQLTKREVRAATLSALSPLPGEVLWDIGAGCGSVAIEWMRAGGKAFAVEPKPDRAERIARNAIRLGVPGLVLLQGSAPGLLPDGAPDAVFVGGGVSEPGLLELCRERLAPGGRLVANAVTAEGEAALLACHGKFGGELTRIAVSRLKAIGGFHTWAPALPVTQYVGWKP